MVFLFWSSKVTMRQFPHDSRGAACILVRVETFMWITLESGIHDRRKTFLHRCRNVGRFLNRKLTSWTFLHRCRNVERFQQGKENWGEIFVSTTVALFRNYVHNVSEERSDQKQSHFTSRQNKTNNNKVILRQ